MENELEFVPQFHAVAVNATEMASASAGIQTWLRNKIHSLDTEVNEARATLDASIRNKWKSSTFRAQLQRAGQRRLYYGKLLAACEAGYTIVPNMPVDVFAIRVKCDAPAARAATATAVTYRPTARPQDETEQRLLPGEGRYESPKQMVITERMVEKNAKGESVNRVTVTPVGFQDIDFPFAVAHPVVMDAVARAMSMKIFDRIGMVSEGAGDPIVLGQMTLGPGWRVKRASFLIAYYLDPRTL